MEQNWVLLTKVPNLIMRGALIHKLGESQIEVYAPDRDAIVNVSSGPNLSLEGYSALFDGYEVYVAKQKLQEAKEILKEIETQTYEPSEGEIDHAGKFYFSAIMSFMIPVIMHVLAIYHLIQARKKKQKLKLVKTIFSFFVLACTAAVLWVALRSL